MEKKRMTARPFKFHRHRLSEPIGRGDGFRLLVDLEEFGASQARPPTHLQISEFDLPL